MLKVYVIYENTSDYPGEFVCRIQAPLGCGAIVYDVNLFSRAKSLEEIRKTLPFGLVRLERAPDDDPVIVETWI